MHIANRWLFLSVLPEEPDDSAWGFPCCTRVLFAFGIKPFAFYIARRHELYKRTLDADGTVREHHRLSSLELWLHRGVTEPRYIDLVLNRSRPHRFAWRPELRRNPA